MARKSRLRALAVVVPVIAAAVVFAVFATGRGGAGVAREATVPLPPVLECFNVQGGIDVNVPVRLTTRNFGGDLVQVRTLAFMCEGALKVRAGVGIGTPGGHVFACYRILRGDDPDDPFTLDTANFPVDRVDVRRSDLMCESARKVRGTLVVGHVGGHVLQCFGLALGQSPNAEATLDTANFVPDDVVITTSTRMCEEAKKTRPTGSIGSITGLVWQCYTLQKGLDPVAQASLTTQNFGLNGVVVRTAVFYCERAIKTALPDFTPTTDPGTEGTTNPPNDPPNDAPTD
jgi:hypothetical protein